VETAGEALHEHCVRRTGTLRNTIRVSYLAYRPDAFFFHGRSLDSSTAIIPSATWCAPTCANPSAGAPAFSMSRRVTLGRQVQDL